MEREALIRILEQVAVAKLINKDLATGSWQADKLIRVREVDLHIYADTKKALQTLNKELSMYYPITPKIALDEFLIKLSGEVMPPAVMFDDEHGLYVYVIQRLDNYNWSEYVTLIHNSQIEPINVERDYPRLNEDFFKAVTAKMAEGAHMFKFMVTDDGFASEIGGIWPTKMELIHDPQIKFTPSAE